MSANMQLSAHWASAHRVLLTVVAIALALAVALTIAVVVSRTTADETIPPGGGTNLNPSEAGQLDSPPVNRNGDHLVPRAR
jgi:hypothetical protein